MIIQKRSDTETSVMLEREEMILLLMAFRGLPYAGAKVLVDELLPK